MWTEVGDWDQWLRAAKNVKWSASITQSYAGKPYLERPKDREFFAAKNLSGRPSGRTCRSPGSEPKWQEALPRSGLGRNENYGRNGNYGRRENYALLRMGAATDVRYVNAGPGPNPRNRVPKYVMAPSPPKLVVDKHLQATQSSPRPKRMEDKAAKAGRQLRQTRSPVT